MASLPREVGVYALLTLDLGRHRVIVLILKAEINYAITGSTCSVSRVGFT